MSLFSMETGPTLFRTFSVPILFACLVSRSALVPPELAGTPIVA